MRSYQRTRVPTRDDAAARKEEPKRERFLRQIAAQVGKLGQGNAPPPSIGIPSAASPPDLNDLSKFFFLPGRPGGQTAYFAKGAGQSGTLVSTANATKGYIYFGLAQTSSFDETNEFIGLSVAAPAAKLDMLAGASADQAAIPTISSSVGAWFRSDNGTQVNLHALVAKTSNDDTTWIYTGSGFGSAVTLGFPVLTAPSAGASHVLIVRARVTGGAPGSPALLKATLDCSAGSSFVISNRTDDGATNLINGTFVTLTYTLTPTDIANLVTYADIRVGLGFSGVQGSATSLDVSRIQLTIEGDLAPLQRWRTGSSYNQLEFSGSDFLLTGFASLLLAMDSSVVGLRIQPLSAHALDVEDSSAVALAGFTSLGNYYLLSGAGALKIYGDINGDGTGGWETAAALGLLSYTAPYVHVTGTYSILTTDYVVDCAGTFTVTLPTAVGVAGRTYRIKNSGSGTITVSTTSSQTIDGGSSAVMSTQYLSIDVVSDGSNWIIV